MTVEQIASLKIPEKFGADDNGDETAAMQFVIDQLYDIKTSVVYHYGASQFVIEDPSDEVVYKIPFNGEFWYNNDDEEETDEDSWHWFNRVNYCELTEEIYDNAVDKGIEKIFAKIERVGTTVSGKPFYAQERIEVAYEDDETERTHSRDSEKEYENLPYFRNRFPADWLLCAIDYYGIDFIKKFLPFAYDLSDLHRGNIGYRFDGSPVIFDYCGYYEG